MKIARDKRGLEIQVGDTLIAGDHTGGILYIEVEGINEDGVVFGKDFDDETYVLQETFRYVSICACYRDARAEIVREMAEWEPGEDTNG